MRLILAREGGKMYAYMETEEHFKKTERHRTSKVLDPITLSHECLLDKIDGDFHMVFKLK